MTFVENLNKAGVRAKLDVYPGLFHAFDMLLPFLPVSRKAAARFDQAFVDAASRAFAPQSDGSAECLDFAEKCDIF